ncbi:MAG: Ig-like domain-containing protein, partial [Telluria sp.]
SDTGVSDHDGLTADATPTLSGVAAEAGGRIELYLNGGASALASADVGAGGAWSLTIPDNLALADGVASLTVKQVDAAGNRGVSSDALAITVDKSAPAVLAKAVLASASDSGISSTDGITNVKTPTLTGTAPAAGTIEIYDGAALIGTTEVQADKSWSFTVGSDPAKLLQFADGVHSLTVKQVDTAGNRSAASSVLSVTVDTVGPTLKNSDLDWNSDKHRYELKFNEQIVFATDASIDVLDVLNLLKSHHTGNVKTNWEIGDDGASVGTVLELSLGSLIGLFGHFHLSIGNGAIQDLAGNAAIIGTPNFDLPGHP